MRPVSSRLTCSASLILLLTLAACQQPRTVPADSETLAFEPPAAGLLMSNCPALPADWLSVIPAHQRLVLPDDCQINTETPAFSWGDARDRQVGSTYSFQLRQKGGAVLMTRSGLAEPRLLLSTSLALGDYEWAVSYTNAQGRHQASQWRRFSIAASSNKSALGAVSTASLAASTEAMPDGDAVALRAQAKARPRMLPAGSSFAQIRSAALAADYLPVLTGLRSRATLALSQPIPAAPDAAATGVTSLSAVQSTRTVVQTARAERFHIENLAVIGRIDGNAAQISAARQRLLALGAWSPTGASSEKNADQANREIFLALAQGLDLLWNELSTGERNTLIAALRARVLQSSTAVSILDRDPYDSHVISNVRWLTQTLVLAAGLPGFPEANTLLTRMWNLGRTTMMTWGGDDGSFGNGIAYAWYNFNIVVPYVASVRSMLGIDLYQSPALRRAGEQLMAFTPPNLRSPSAFGDEMETLDLYNYYASNYYRLHAHMTRSPQDAWYWQVNPANLSRPNEPLIWQLLILGTDSSALPRPQAPTQNDWFFDEAGLAALHVNSAQTLRTSLFFRSSRFGAFNHSHADQNSIAYVSQGQPLLVNAGYYPYYNSPHHKNTRATRYKNALTYDGGFGQSESSSTAVRPSDPAHSMDASGKFTNQFARGNLTLVTGDATLAYRGIDPVRGTWVPALSNALRTVVMDKANGVTLIYDWATSAQARQWELNFHSPNPFAADAVTVRASNGSASVCLDRHGPATSFAQTQAWEIAPEVSKPAQSHARFTALTRSTEFAHLTVLRDGCRNNTSIRVTQNGTQFQVQLGTQLINFDKRNATLP